MIPLSLPALRDRLPVYSVAKLLRIQAEAVRNALDFLPNGDSSQWGGGVRCCRQRLTEYAEGLERRADSLTKEGR